MLGRARTGVFLVTGMATLLFAAPTASALTKVKAWGEDVGGGIYAGTAECSADQRVVSGGFSAFPDGYAVVNKAKGSRGWRVKAHNSDSLKIFAFCSDKRRVSKEADTVAFPAGSEEERTAKARCEAGRQAVYGGWSFKPSGELASNQPVFKSRRKDGNKWAVTAFADTEAGEQDKLKAFVYCLGPKVDLRTRSINVREPVEPGERGGQEAKCNEREEFLGGTFLTRPKSDFGGETGPNLFYAFLGRGGYRSWAVEAYNYGQVPGRIKATAICAV